MVLDYLQEEPVRSRAEVVVQKVQASELEGWEAVESRLASNAQQISLLGRL
jgi:hypothetical protein